MSDGQKGVTTERGEDSMYVKRERQREREKESPRDESKRRARRETRERERERETTTGDDATTLRATPIGGPA